ncbi:PhzF family phenazine biosynthesis protein [Paraglaciecola marina]|uniref:PhzF family phenazine biosynthesis protein n=1 Tax=Paraglaciecola marina TaxID=2500157 RepID=UPI00105C5E87|nr:PhzF family phenazine biosynthesis protein [Paraglaciecola marina]
MNINVAILNSFIDGTTGGNPAGVVLNADTLSTAQKLTIAQQVGLSETAFVSASSSADFKLDFFTPEKQIAHCGHATIATFSYLSQLNLITNPKTSKETIEGNRDIEIKGDLAYMEQLAPTYQNVDSDRDDILKALGITQNQLLKAPMIANTGNSFLIVGVKSKGDLTAIKPNQTLIAKLSKKYNLIGFYVFTTETNQGNRDASSRMFAPYYGIDEESATGMAAGPLACYLYDEMEIHKDTFVIEQGYAMQPASPSCIEVMLTLKNNTITKVTAGGTATVSKMLDIEID